jgi:hypothetical protein
VAALSRAKKYQAIRDLLKEHFVVPRVKQTHESGLAAFDAFWDYAPCLKHALTTTEGHQFMSPVGELAKRLADRDDIPFNDLMQAEAIVFLVALLKDMRWYPHTLGYARHGKRFPLFQKATRSRDFERTLGLIAETDAASLSRNALEKLASYQFDSLSGLHSTLRRAMNLDALGSVP